MSFNVSSKVFFCFLRVLRIFQVYFVLSISRPKLELKLEKTQKNSKICRFSSFGFKLELDNISGLSLKPKLEPDSNQKFELKTCIGFVCMCMCVCDVCGMESLYVFVRDNECLYVCVLCLVCVCVCVRERGSSTEQRNV